jgi:hypothetical protein
MQNVEEGRRILVFETWSQVIICKNWLKYEKNFKTKLKDLGRRVWTGQMWIKILESKGLSEHGDKIWSILNVGIMLTEHMLIIRLITEFISV